MRDKTQKPGLEPGTYRHFKGETYEVLDIVRDWNEGVEDGWQVRYRTALGEVGVRKYEDFIGGVFRDGKAMPRFEKVKE